MARGMNENSSLPVPSLNAFFAGSQTPASKAWSWPSLLPTTSILRRFECFWAKQR